MDCCGEAVVGHLVSIQQTERVLILCTMVPHLQHCNGHGHVLCVAMCCSQAVAYIPPHQAHLIHAVARWSAAAMWVGKALVRQGAPLREELRGEDASQMPLVLSQYES
jgi:hypothetical protein